MGQLKINLKDNVPRSKSKVSEENARLQHVIYQVRLLSLTVRDHLVFHAARFISIMQSKHKCEEINESNLQVKILKEAIYESFLSWLIDKINLPSKNTYCLLYLAQYHGDQWNSNLLRRITQKSDNNQPERLILFFNVGKYHTETFIEEPYEKNNKYSACHYFLFIYIFFYPIKHIIGIRQVAAYHVN